MATKNKQQHLGNREDYQDAAAYLEDFGTLEGWEAPVGATYKTGEELMNFWKSAGVDKNNDGTLSAEEMRPQMDATLAYWNAKPKRNKMNAISEEFRRTLPYVAAVAPFAGAGSVLGSVAKGTSGLGKLGAILTGGGNFSKNPMVNMMIKQALSKAAGGAGMDTLGSVMKMGSMGHGAADMFNKGIYAPEKVRPTMANGITQGEHDWGKSDKYSLSSLGRGEPEKYTLGGLDDPNAGNQYGLSGSLPDLPPFGSDNETMQEILDLQKYGFNPGAPGHGGQRQSTTPRPIPGLSTTGGAGGMRGGGGTAGGGMNPVAMGLMTSLLGKAFEGDNKPSPAPAPAPTGGAGLPTYGSLIGMATNRDAMEDQRNRLKFGRRTA